MYATYLTCFSMTDDKEEMVNEMLNYNYAASGMFRIIDARFDNPEQLDFDFHLLHRIFPSIRKNAIEIIGEEKRDSLSIKTKIITKDDNGETFDVTPIIEEIKRELSHLDLVVKFRETYFHDHVDRERGFQSENLVVEIYALDEDTKERAKEIIKKVAGILYED